MFTFPEENWLFDCNLCVFLLGLKCVQSDVTGGESQTKGEASVSRANAGLKQMTVECNSKPLMWSVV